MQVNNTFSLLNYNTNLENKKEPEIAKTNSFVKAQKSEFYLDIKNDINSRTNSGYLRNKEIDEKINTLKDIKNILERELLPKYDVPLSIRIIDPSEIEINIKSLDHYQEMYLSSVSDSEIKEERDKLIPFLNPNQKFLTRESKSAFLSQYQSLKVNLSFFSPQELKTLSENTSKAASKSFNSFDKENDFDSVISLVYYEKKKIESENSLLLNKEYIFDSRNKDSSFSETLSISERISNSFKNSKTSDSSGDKLNISDQLEKIQEIKEKVLEASSDTTSLKEKEDLIKDIKDLLEGFDGDFVKKISSNLDNIMEKNKDEFSVLTTTNIDILSPSEAKKYLEDTVKFDINFVNLSTEEKTIYIKNKETIANYLMSSDSIIDNVKEKIENKDEKKTFSAINDDLSNILQKELQEEDNDIKKLIGWTRTSYSVDEAIDFLDTLERRSSEISRMSEVEKSSFENSKVLAKQAIRFDQEQATHIQRDAFVKNIDNFIYTLNNLKDIEEIDDGFIRDIDYKKESESFDSQNIKQQNGNFLLSQSLNIKTSNSLNLLS